MEWVQTILIFNPPEKRFVSPVSDAQVAVMSKGYIAPNTKKNTNSAMTCFREWRSARNKNITKDDKRWCPENLENPSIDKLNRQVELLDIMVHCGGSKQEDRALHPKVHSSDPHWITKVHAHRES